MRHRKKKKILSRKAGPRKALIRGLACQLATYGKIKTTEAKAKALRPFFERLITHSKKNVLSARRLIIKRIGSPAVAKKIIEEIGPRYKDRQGGYTRIIKLGPRAGDRARMAVIELI